MRALVTRPRDDALELARELEARGIEVLIEPLIDILPRPGAEASVEGVQALLLTSANGVRALAAVNERRDLPVYAVGDATARAARALGYGRVEAAGGDVVQLAALVAARLDPKAGALLHAAGSEVAGDLAGALGGAGFAVRRAVLYDAKPATRLGDAAREALSANRLDAALFFSPRTASAFVTLVQAGGLGPACGSVAGYALSAAVARSLADVPWRVVRVAARPDQASLLALLDADRAARA